MKHSFSLSALVAVAAAVQAHVPGDNVPVVTALALAPRHGCSDECVPKLCIGEATMSGETTQLTYVCPETKQVSTVHVTVTETTTVTPTAEMSILPIDGSASFAPTGGQSEEFTTTMTMIATSTLYTTITLKRKTSSEIVPPTLPAVVTTTEPETSIPPITESEMPFMPFPSITGPEMSILPITESETSILPITPSSGTVPEMSILPTTSSAQSNSSCSHHTGLYSTGTGLGTAASTGTGLGAAASTGTGIPNSAISAHPIFANSTTSPSIYSYKYPPTIVARGERATTAAYPGAVTQAMGNHGGAGQAGVPVVAGFLGLMVAMGM